MSQLQSLRAAFSLHHIAALLQFRPKALAFILYKKPPLTKYQSFNIAKRGGGVRQINAPSPELMLLQSRVSDLLLNCLDEINSTRKLQDQLAHGFKRHRSIITNATKHRKRRYVFNIDLQDFFPTINFGRIRGFFIKDANQSKPDSTIHFSKAILSQYVRENAAKIDFSGFAGILDRISAAIEAHQAKSVKPAVAEGVTGAG